MELLLPSYGFQGVPQLLVSRHNVDRTPEICCELGQLYEIERIYYGTKWRNGSKFKINIELSTTRRLAKQMTEWACRVNIQMASSGQVDWQLNRSDHNLCLIDGLIPEISELSSGMIVIVANPGNCGLRPKSIIDSSLVDRKLSLKLQNTIQRTSNVGSEVVELSSGREDDTNSSNNDGEIEIELQQQQHRLEHSRCLNCVSWFTIDEFQWLRKRANLIFYYTQTNPELARQMLATLLDSVQLIESAADSGSSSSWEPHWSQLQVDWCCSRGILANLGANLLGANEAATRLSTSKVGADGRQQKQLIGSLLSRRALVAKPVAYLNPKQALELGTSTSGEAGWAKNLLAQQQHLIGFLRSAYSNRPSSSSPRLLFAATENWMRNSTIFSADLSGEQLEPKGKQQSCCLAHDDLQSEAAADPLISSPDNGAPSHFEQTLWLPNVGDLLTGVAGGDDAELSMLAGGHELIAANAAVTREQLAPVAPNRLSQSLAASGSTNLTKDLGETTESSGRPFGVFNELAYHLGSSYNNMGKSRSFGALLEFLFILDDNPTRAPTEAVAKAQKLSNRTDTPSKPSNNTATSGSVVATKSCWPAAISLPASAATGSQRCSSISMRFNLSWGKILTNLLQFAILVSMIGRCLRVARPSGGPARDNLAHLRGPEVSFGGQTLRQAGDYGENLNENLLRDDDDHGNFGPSFIYHSMGSNKMLFGTLMGAEANSQAEPEPGDHDSPNGGAKAPDYYHDGEDKARGDEEEELEEPEEQEGEDEDDEAGDKLIDNLFSALLSGGAGGGPGGGFPFDLSKLMSNLGAGGQGGEGGGLPAGLSEMFAGKNPAGMDMAQLEALLKNLMMSANANVEGYESEDSAEPMDESKLLDHQSEKFSETKDVEKVATVTEKEEEVEEGSTEASALDDASIDDKTKTDTKSERQSKDEL